MADEMPTKAEWEAHQAFYKLTVAQRDGAWRESEVLRDALRKLIAAHESDGDVEYALRFAKGTLARVEEFTAPPLPTLEGWPPMKDETFTLPDLARIAGIGYRTAHVWMKDGLIEPSIRETDGTGYPALFSADDVCRAIRLARLRRAGLSIDGLRRVVDDPARLRDLLSEWTVEERKPCR